uniref:Uncharacterized protein n=1 Tax=Nothobranchius furzeri TaxID=105023 RepID=A0A8C6VW67_NOTFU
MVKTCSAVGCRNRLDKGSNIKFHWFWAGKIHRKQKTGKPSFISASVPKHSQCMHRRK